MTHVELSVQNDKISSREDNLLEKWNNKFSILRNQHMQKAKDFNKINNIIGIINIIFSISGSILSSIFAFDSINIDKTVSYVLVGVCHYVVLIIHSVTHFYSFSSKEQSHLKSSHKYAELLREIELQRILPENDRDLKKIIDEYNKLIENEPLIN
tara:strand:- start:63 stop:527 length:465 start_codon:yes stop_codon:yes gene_type:complete